jgi:hypothetical protein
MAKPELQGGTIDVRGLFWALPFYKPASTGSR